MCTFVTSQFLRLRSLGITKLGLLLSVLDNNKCGIDWSPFSFEEKLIFSAFKLLTE